MKYSTLSDACHAWVGEFNSVPQSVLQKLMNYEGWESIKEITPIHKYSRVRVVFDEYAGEEGEVIGTKYDGEPDLYEVKLDCDPDNPKIISEDCLEEIPDGDYFPMWSTMWQFSDPCDDEWLTGEYLGPHLQEMADLGFRIYEQEDYGVVFGIDGCGYNFFDEHFIPLYKLRGLHWHKEDDSNGTVNRSDRTKVY